MTNTSDSARKSVLTNLICIRPSFFILLCLLAMAGCTKEKVSPAIEITPKENDIKYKYTIENISGDDLFTFNNDPANPKENYPEVKISAGQTMVVQALSSGKITPMIRSDKPGIQTEFVYNYLTEIYQINGYMNLFEAAITGDANLVSIFFPNPVSGKQDSLVNVKLPQTLHYKTYEGQKIEIIVSKEVVGGTILLTTKIKGKTDSIKSTSASQGVITSITDVAKKTSVVTVTEPTAAIPAVPNPTNPASPAGPSAPANPAAPSSCGMYNGKPVYSGPRGGCYYINSNGNKTYVVRNFCC